MFRIKSIGNAIKTRFAKVTASAISCFERLTVDIFDKQTVPLKIASDYLSDVVFEKSGNIFPIIKAKFQGRPIATTKNELFEQLQSLNPNSDFIGSKKYIQKQIKKSISGLDKKDCKSIARISKFIHEINVPDNQNLYRIKLRLCLGNHTLSAVDKLLTHPRAFCLSEIEQIVSHTYDENLKYLDALLNSDPSIIKNNSIASHMNTLPLEGDAEMDNIRAISRIREKLTNMEDSKIKNFVDTKLSEIPAELKTKLEINPNCFIPNDGVGELEKLELLLDSYHSVNNHYSAINGDVQKYYKHLKAKVTSDNAIPEEIKELQEITTLNPAHKMSEYDNLNPASQAECFNEAVRLEPLKEFIGKYSKIEPEMTDYLYEKYFLTKIPERLRDSYRRVKSEFGTYVFTENSEKILVDKRIYPELDNWRKASNGKAKYPSILDLSHAKQNFIDEKPADGFYYKKLNSINLPNDYLFYSFDEETIRHEMAHLNDANFGSDGIINGVNSDDIIKNRTYADELKSAGINDFYVDYAHKNRNELIAVAATGDYTKYSKEFKDVLVKLGMPEWVFNLKPLIQV